MQTIQTVVTVKCLDQSLQMINAPRIASGGVNDVRAEFEFCPLWDGLVKTAVFYTDQKVVYHQVLVDDACDVPPEVLAAPGLMYMGVFGVNADGTIVRTSVTLVLTVEEGAITEATAVSDPTPELYQQVLAEVQKAREVAEQTSEQQSAFESEVRQVVEAVPEQAAAAGAQAAQEAIEQLTPGDIGAAAQEGLEEVTANVGTGWTDISSQYAATVDNASLPITGISVHRRGIVHHLRIDFKATAKIEVGTKVAVTFTKGQFPPFDMRVATGSYDTAAIGRLDPNGDLTFRIVAADMPSTRTMYFAFEFTV